MTRGLFITLEGIEGVGKSTAVTRVATLLRAARRTVVTTREPGGTALGERIRELVLAPSAGAMVPLTELLLMFAARAQHVAAVIEPALAAGSDVVCDRFTDASYAYQGAGRGIDRQLIAQAERLVHPDLQPDLTVLLDAPPAVGMARVHARGAADRFEQERSAFFDRVRAGYLERAHDQPARFAIVDATQALGAVGAEIDRIVSARVP